MRKIHFLLAFFIISSTASFAQLEKNNLYTGFSFARGLGNGTTAYELQPSASYALDKHSLLTLYGRYQRGREFINPFGIDRTGRIRESGIGVGYTYYRNFKGSKKWGWFLEASASVNRISSYDIKSGVTQSIHRYTEKQLLIKPGIFYQASRRVMFFADFGSLRLLGDSHTNDFGKVFNVGVRITLGKVGKKTKG